ncbi:NAD(P)H-binding protein [Secundilactobacillus paracollinoides]|uniref:Oxidoreductase n=1 Tax=Secundilactobacillus paracollinoides TaxID=240427 RepID=A0A1B2IX55_9LACO|nr:NAD(P)H-binding protein [Secundilactobacillus paracollinoides]ANZ60766.1 oxidoreductase [Secundilactobacillus paracollinoides]ANZ66610.1 oxidoreductase [Secundilactobacillus paracollinoides]
MKVLILGANGQIAKFVENRILTEDQFKDIELTLFLRDRSRLQQLADNPRVTLVEGNLTDEKAVQQAMAGQQLVLIATVDTDSENTITTNVIQAMKAQHVDRVLAASSIGIYAEEPNPQFYAWNQSTLSGALAPMRQASELLQQSGLTYTTMRFAWLNNHDAINYTITEKGEKFAGGSGSRKSMADAILKMIADPTLYANKVIGISDPETKDAPSVVN